MNIPTRPFFRMICVLATSSLSAMPLSSSEAQTSLPITKSSKRPNILFIAVDDLRPSLGCYGDAVAISPNIDRLAERGLKFNLAFCQVAVCNPSRASLMTGQRPDNLGVWTLPIHFRESKPDAITMPQWFRKLGYTAISHGKIYHNPTPDPQSWSEPIRDLPKLPYPYLEGTRESIKAAQDRLPNDDWRKNNLRGPSTASPELADDQLLDGARTNMAIEDLRRLGKQDEPFFLAMGYIRPHLAWVAPKKYWDLHDPAKLPVLQGQKPNANAPKYALMNNSELSHYVDLIDFPTPWEDDPLSDETARHLVHAYYACVSYVDAQIGRLLATLEEEGLADNTIVVLWSDHGWKLGEYRGWGKMTNYEIDTRVPFIISVPRSLANEYPTAGQTSEQLVELLDLFPTLCDLSGIQKPDFIDGTSLAPILKNPNASVHDGAVSQYYRRVGEEEFMGYSIRTRTHRLTEWRNFSSGEVASRELYDHQQSGLEIENMIDSASADLIDSLTKLLLQNHPRQALTMTPTVHSTTNPGRFRVKLGFSNSTDGPITIYPITSKGRRGRGKKLAAGEQWDIKARLGGVFVVESKDGSIHEIHSPSFPSKTVDVDGK